MTTYATRKSFVCPANDNHAPQRLTVWVAFDTPEINEFLAEQRVDEYDGITRAKVDTHLYLWGDIPETRGVLASLVSAHEEIGRLVVKPEFLQYKLQRQER